MLYRRIFIQVPLQFVCVIKLFILKVGNNLSAFFCEYRLGVAKKSASQQFSNVKLSLTDLSTCWLSSPPQKGIILTWMYHLKIFRNNNQGSFQRERCLLFFLFSFEDWGNKYLPQKLSAQNRVLIFNSDVAIGVEY